MQQSQPNPFALTTMRRTMFPLQLKRDFLALVTGEDLGTGCKAGCDLADVRAELGAGVTVASCRRLLRFLPEGVTAAAAEMPIPPEGATAEALSGWVERCGWPERGGRLQLYRYCARSQPRSRYLQQVTLPEIGARDLADLRLAMMAGRAKPEEEPGALDLLLEPQILMQWLSFGEKATEHGARAVAMHGSAPPTRVVKDIARKRAELMELTRECAELLDRLEGQGTCATRTGSQVVAFPTSAVVSHEQ